MQMIKLKQMLLQKCLQLIYFYFGAAKSGRTSSMACALGPISGRATAAQ